MSMMLVWRDAVRSTTTGDPRSRYHSVPEDGGGTAVNVACTDHSSSSSPSGNRYS